MNGQWEELEKHVKNYKNVDDMKGIADQMIAKVRASLRDVWAVVANVCAGGVIVLIHLAVICTLL